MANSQYTTFALSLASTLTSPLKLTSPASPLVYNYNRQHVTGTGAGASDMQWSDTRTLTASSAEDLDLAGSLIGPFGATLTFARIKGLIIVAAAANTNNVVVSSPASNAVPLFGGTTGSISLGPDELFCWFSPAATGKVVTASTGDLIHVANSGAGSSVNYDVVIIGASA